MVTTGVETREVRTARGGGGGPLNVAAGSAWAGALEAALDLLAVATQDGRLHWINAAWTQTLGWTLDELRSRSYFDRLHPSDRARTRHALAEHAAGRAASTVVHRVESKAGTWVPLVWTSRAPSSDGFLFWTASPLQASKALASPFVELAEQVLLAGHWQIDTWRRTIRLTPTASQILGVTGPDQEMPLETMWSQLRAAQRPDLEAVLRDAMDGAALDALVTNGREGADKGLIRIVGLPDDGGAFEGPELRDPESDAGPRTVSGLVLDVTAERERERARGAREAEARVAADRRAALLRLSETDAKSFSSLYEAYSRAGCDYTGLEAGGVYVRVGSGLQASPPRNETMSVRMRQQLERTLVDGSPTFWTSPVGDGEVRQVLLAAPIRAQFTLRGVLAFFGEAPFAHQPASDLEFVVLAATALGRAIETLEASRRTSYQRSLFEGLFRQTPDGIFLEDVRQRRVLMVNESLCRMLGYARDEMVGRKTGFLYCREQDFVTLSGAARRPAPLELSLRTREGAELPVELVSTEINDDRGQPIAVMRHVRDITQRQAMETIKQEFIAVASHELRTPLTATLGSLSLLKEISGDLPDDLAELVDLACRSGERLRLLVDDILDIQRLEGGRLPMTRVGLDLREVADEAVRLNASMARHFEGEFVVSGPSCHVSADPRRIQQVLTNLLSNASKHAPLRSRVRVEVWVESGYACCAVADQGPGIPESFRGRVFDKFTQAEASSVRKTSGSGLGLAITKALVEEHGGDIEFECPSTGGTTFTFRLPLVVEPRLHESLTSKQQEGAA